MKNKLMLLFLSAFFFMTLSSMQMPQISPAPNELRVDFTVVDDLRVQLDGQNQTGKTLHLRILSQERNVFGYMVENLVFTEKVAPETADFKRLLNLSQLKSGSYILELRAGKHRVHRRLEISSKPAERMEPVRVIALN